MLPSAAYGVLAKGTNPNINYLIAYYIPIFGLVENGIKPNIYMLSY